MTIVDPSIVTGAVASAKAGVTGAVAGVTATTGGTIGAAAGVGCVGLCCCYCGLKAILKKLVAKAAPSVLGGSKVDLKNFKLWCCPPLTFGLKGLTLHNLEDFKSDYLLHLGKLSIKIGLCGAICSRGKTISIPYLTIDDLHFILEEGLTTSNLSALQAAMKKANPDPAAEEETGCMDHVSGAFGGCFEGVSNAPENAKGKMNDAKDKMNDAKGKLNDTVDNATKKKDAKKKGEGVKIGVVRLRSCAIKITTVIQEERGASSSWIPIPPMNIDANIDANDLGGAVNKIIMLTLQKVLESPAALSASVKDECSIS